MDAYYDDTSIHGMTCHYGLGAVEGQQMAAVLANSLREEADWKIRDTKESDLFVLNNSNMPGVLLETGFISNSQDLANLTDPDYLKRLAARIAEGLLDYLESTALPSGT